MSIHVYLEIMEPIIRQSIQFKMHKTSIKTFIFFFAIINCRHVDLYILPFWSWFSVMFDKSNSGVIPVLNRQELIRFRYQRPFQTRMPSDYLNGHPVGTQSAFDDGMKNALACRRNLAKEPRALLARRPEESRKGDSVRIDHSG